MDEQRFDQLSRRVASVRTRRQAIKALAGAVVGVMAGTRAAAAQNCTAHSSPCGGDGDCCSGAVCEYGLCMPGCRIEGTFYSPWSMPAGDTCQVCAPEQSTTSWSAANEGMSCWSGDPNAGPTTCQGGVCTGQTARSCPPPTPCHLEGEVDPVTGLCVNPPAPAGTLCGNASMCYDGFYQPADTCDGNGFCIGGGSQTVYCEPVDDCTPACTEAGCAQASVCTGFDTCMDGVCACVPDCDGRNCGDDGCGGVCGVCPGFNDICTEGSCCSPAPFGCELSCGGTFADGCGNTITCPPVVCNPGATCLLGTCICLANPLACLGSCGGQVPDGCGGFITCPTINCGPLQVCAGGTCILMPGICNPPCLPGSTCVAGSCVPTPIP